MTKRGRGGQPAMSNRGTAAPRYHSPSVDERAAIHYLKLILTAFED